MDNYSESKISNDPLHKMELTLMSMKKELKNQALYLDYVFNKSNDDSRKLLIRPVPKEVGTLMLTIVRNKSGFNRWHPKYTLVAYIVDNK